MIEAIILGIIQGFTEFIPVSSSGHLSIVPRLFEWGENSASFDIVLHSGTLFALLINQRKELKEIGKITLQKRNYSLVTKLIIAIIPSIFIGTILQYTETNLDSSILIFVTLSLGSLFMFIADYCANKVQGRERLETKDAIIVGLAQPLAFMRGTSRSGATIVAGVFSGLKLHEAVKFSFLISIPVITIACLMSLYEILSNGVEETADELLIGFIAAFVAGTFAIKFMLKFTKNRGLKWFAIYRLLLAFIILFSLI